MLPVRLQTYKEELLNKPRQVCIERAVLFTESYKATEGEPAVIRRAKALRHVLENHELTLDEHDLIVGNRTQTPRAGVISPEMSPYWILDEIDKFETRDQDKFVFSEKDKTTFKEELYPYWASRSLKDYYQSHVSEDVVNATKTRIFAINQTDKGQGHIIPDYEVLLQKGFRVIAQEITTALQAQPENNFLQAAKIVIDASIAYVLRNKEFVEQQIANTKDATRIEELKVMVNNLERIAYDTPTNLYEAIQLFWMQCLILQHESNASSISLGRFDHYMYPFFEETALNHLLLQNLYLKMNTIVFIRSTLSAKFFAGFPSGYTLMLSGIGRDGKDATNALSYKLLAMHEDIQLPQPNLSVRVSKQSPKDLLTLASKMIRLGNGLPQLFSDEVNIQSFTNRNITLEDARDYGVVGCVELSIPHKMYGLHDIAMFNLLKCLEVTMKQKTFTSYDELKAAIKETINIYVKHMVVGSNLCDDSHAKCAPTPFLSIFMDGCIATGKDVTEGGTIYNFSGVQGIGCPNLSDSLYVIKKAVFEEKKLTFNELVEILDNNYEGHEKMRQMFIHQYDKYGNDNDEVDYLGAELLTHYCEEVAKYKNVRGGYFQPGSYTVSAHIPLGEAVNATPDGRKAKEQLADGGLSPMVSRDTNGPTASLKSVSKLDNYLTSNGSLLNVKFSPSVLADDAGIEKLVAYIKAFNALDIQHIQFNVQSKQTLIDAQNNPEKHRDLVIRVAGYSAMFTELSKAIQDDIINRSEHTF